jgi:hypothetical protein
LLFYYSSYFSIKYNKLSDSIVSSYLILSRYDCHDVVVFNRDYDVLCRVLNP